MDAETSSAPPSPAPARVTPAGTVPVLMYHSVSERTDEPFRDLAVTPAVLAEQLDQLHALGYTTCTMTELVAALGAGRAERDRLVALTFDDAFEDFVEHALPVLRSRSASATLYVPTGHVGATAAWMDDPASAATPIATWDQLRHLATEPSIEIGSHGHAHLMLDAVRTADAIDDIGRSKAELEAHLGGPVHSFCYPFGFHRPAIVRAVEAAGFTSACETGQGLHAVGSSLFTIRRLTISHDTVGPALRAALAGEHPPRLDRIRRGLAIPAWRAYRQVTMRTIGRPGPAPQRFRYWLG